MRLMALRMQTIGGLIYRFLGLEIVLKIILIRLFLLILFLLIVLVLNGLTNEF